MKLDDFVHCYAWKYDNNVVLISAVTRLCRDRKITPIDACELITHAIEAEFGEETGREVHERLKIIPNQIQLLELAFGDEYRKPQPLQGGKP